jgi:hypothetical protein
LAQASVLLWTGAFLLPASSYVWTRASFLDTDFPEFGSTEAHEETRRQKKLDTDYTDFQDSEEERRQILLEIL